MSTPLLLFDNYLDTVNLYPGATLSASEEPDGFEAFRVADYRRERSYWRPDTDGGATDHFIKLYHGAGGAKSVDYIVIDRDSTIENMTVYLEGSPDNVVWNVSQALNIPAGNTVGGNPAWPSLARTEEGVAYGLAAAPLAARLYWRLRIPHAAGFRPIVTGLMFGMKTQLLGYSNVFDEDAGERTQSTELSTAGYRGSARTFAWRTCELGLGAIGGTEYDTAIRAARDALFVRQAPFMLFMDYATKPERGWLFEYDGTTWGMPKSRVLRSGRIRGREVGARII